MLLKNAFYISYSFFYSFNHHINIFLAVVEYVPVQNQAAAQKLLQKLNNQNQNDQHYKGRKYKGKEKREEPSTLTLDEWERRKAGAKPSMGYEHPNISHDEELAWQLQNQFDLQDSNVSILAS